MPFVGGINTVSAAVAMLLFGGASDVLAITVSAASTCISSASNTVYRTNPGGTDGAGMTSQGSISGSGGGTYGWVSGCATVGTGLGYVVLGSFANAGSYTAVRAIGIQAGASAGFATALGAEYLVRGIASSAFGTGRIASGRNSVSIGGGGASTLSAANSTTANANGVIAIGVNDTKGAQAMAADAIALGGQSQVVGAATSGSAIGRGATVNGAFGSTQGDGAVSGAMGQNVAIGSSGTTANSGTAASGAVAIGRGQRATAMAQWLSAIQIPPIARVPW
ncbi:hypothetical protein J2W23_003777 [Variovorax boronicumulans]|uniref:hypothetical protein n=1 Tax=Variovorax boronicumulans TaxID=436515 RepID=UPI002785D9F1|nr:hypothetical protein [Variovorax boronicumulans]MDQ0015377.1 hypothetical protein [Variovorax boronicumulans]